MFIFVGFEHFLEELADFFAGVGESAAAGGRGGIGLASAAFDESDALAEPSALFHAVKQRIDGAGTEAVAVAAELGDDAEAEDRAFGGMVQDVQAHEPYIEFLTGAGCAFLFHWTASFVVMSWPLRMASEATRTTWSPG